MSVTNYHYELAKRIPGFISACRDNAIDKWIVRFEIAGEIEETAATKLSDAVLLAHDIVNNLASDLYSESKAMQWLGGDTIAEVFPIAKPIIDRGDDLPPPPRAAL